VSNLNSSEAKHILIVEDLPSDAELVKREAQNTLHESEFMCVETEEGFLEALDSFQPDMILSDYSLPSFDGMRALKLAIEHVPGIPFILVTGSINEETAVTCMKAGAWDYVLKEHLKPLGSAIEKAFEKKQLREDKIRAEEALRESEEKYRLIVENANDGIEISQDDKIIYSNTRFANMLGYSVDEIKGLSFESIFTKQAKRGLKERRRMEESEGISTDTYEAEFYRKDKSIIYVEVKYEITEFKRKPATFAIVRDITERKQAEESLRENHAKHAAMIANISDVIVIMDADGITKYQSPNIKRLFGWKAEEIVGTNGLEKVHPEDIQRIQQVLINLLEEETASTHEFRLRCKDSNYKWIELTAINRINDPAINGVLLNYHDISERKQTEEAFLQNQKRYKKAQSMGHVGNWEYDPLTTNFWGSDEAKRIYGFELESKDFTSEKVESCIPERERVHQALTDLLEEDKKYDLEFDILTHDKGIRKTIQSIAEIERDVVGNPIKITGVISDITEHKLAEAALKESEANYRNIVHDQTEYIMRYLPDGTRTFVNDSYCQAFNVSREDVLGTNFLEGSSESARRRLEKKIAALTSENQVLSDEHESKLKDGSKIWRLWVDRGIFDEKGILKEIQATGRDITKRKLAEIARELALQEATAANEVKDQFVANISHEVRTPLNSILGFSDLLKQRYSDIISEKDRGIFGYITAAGDRLMHTVDSILNLSLMKAGTIKIHKQELDLGSITTQVVEQLNFQALDKRLDLNFTSPKRPQTIFADEYCIHQSILNLTDNAIKYTKEGKIELKFGHRDDRVTLSVIDTGIGISEEYQKRLFDAYTQESEGFTKSYQGVGLGLALTKQYLELNDVELEFESKQHVGSTFTLRFPKYTWENSGK